MEKLSLCAAAISLLPIGNIIIAVLMTKKSKSVNFSSIIIGYICTLCIMALFTFCSGLPMLYFGWLALISFVAIVSLLLPTYLYLDLLKIIIKFNDEKINYKHITVCTFSAVTVDCIVWSIVWAFYAYFEIQWMVYLLNSLHFAVISIQSLPIILKMIDSKFKDKIVFTIGASGVFAIILVNTLGALLTMNYYSAVGLISQFGIGLILCRVISFVLPGLAVLFVLYLIRKNKKDIEVQ